MSAIKTRARNERLEKELSDAIGARDEFKATLERSLAISNLALWNRKPDRVEEVGPKENTSA